MIHHPKFVIPTEGTAPFAVPGAEMRFSIARFLCDEISL
jgi:hypothetical protein